MNVPKAAWPSIDRTINAVTKSYNEGVPDVGREVPTHVAIGRDKLSRRFVVTAVRFRSDEVRVRQASGETWRRFA
jgi:hypothetical protein